MIAETITAPALVIVGGPTCVGKTELVEALVRLYPERFCRARSVTSRARREAEGDDEYSFVSEAGVRAMAARGELLALDEAYGNLYGISRGSVSQAIAGGLCPVKEVHPANHARLSLAQPGLVSVLICGEPRVGGGTDAARLRRLGEDAAFYARHDALSHDIVFTVQPGATVEGEAARLAGLVGLLLSLGRDYPRPAEIDRANRAGYDAIAAEFDDGRRVTTANFHACTSRFFEAELGNYGSGTRCLEVGPGAGWLRKEVKWPAVDYTAVDLAPSMGAVADARGLVRVGSARSLPFASGEFDVVVASLADPFTYPLALAEIRRVLRPGGRYVFTAPSRHWAELLRGPGGQHTTFVRSDGMEAAVYSFTHTPGELHALLGAVGFGEVAVTEISPMPALRDRPVSPAITGPMAQSGQAPDAFPLLNAVTATCT